MAAATLPLILQDLSEAPTFLSDPTPVVAIPMLYYAACHHDVPRRLSSLAFRARLRSEASLADATLPHADACGRSHETISLSYLLLM